ncbi:MULTISPECIES: DNA cytosine methyltransferase [unclassified Pseudomonas]|uniref:DNA cytosine methyltransferase n=1 Tax=unclassified Pseudomonas TaxID=196821 RepID=UPI00089957A1|nr:MULTISPECIES: DNA cytosine methyltransferase [unclassified Pseudomonas]SDY34753.1 DNA (cytosine-5)-methyltransferase 1 [Pseudomonas sp. NFACC08-1]SFM07500.1 DNA (cytosine-5)-methyltransferase 1 [Pseudomonas sp. NFACC46-3]
MNCDNPLQVVDLFAGPGGLGEGFSSLSEGRSFDILVSAEMDPFARSTLRLRAFYRALKKYNPAALADYYYYCETAGVAQPWTSDSYKEWQHADAEARQIKLGSVEGNAELDRILEKRLDTSKPWVLIGGPPCQAYSIVGRARNKGNVDYKAEDDHRHFLYREYLRIIQSKRPAVFVMENVKGILSSKVGGTQIFPQILQDLADPDAALGIKNGTGKKYKICSLVSDDIYESGMTPDSIDFNNFIIRAEDYGIPQGRHRVILVGVSEDYVDGISEHKLASAPPVTVRDVLGNLPPLRSTLSRGNDTPDKWCNEILGHLETLYKDLISSENKDLTLEMNLRIFRDSFSGGRLNNGGLRVKKTSSWSGAVNTDELNSWLTDSKLGVWLNHEARSHMSADLKRYIYASVFAQAHHYSPKGHQEFNLPGLAPDHKNWESGKFSDRFRVQIDRQHSSTITSHISKDGHYFIHYDPNQCRSLTVREAARLQTFPDNYFFLGNRTQQYHQVGNAVPPLLASKIARVVERIIKGRISSQRPERTVASMIS